jgi:hypothetical protein
MKRGREEDQEGETMEDDNEYDLDKPFYGNDRIEPPEGSLVAYNSELLESGKGSDVTLKLGDETFPLHKNILRRSGYFSTLFDGQWSSPSNQEFDLRGIVNTVPGANEFLLQKLFHLLYTDRVDTVDSESCVQLGHLAKFFDVPYLLQALFKAAHGFDKLALGQEFDLFQGKKADTMLFNACMDATSACSRLDPEVLISLATLTVQSDYVETYFTSEQLVPILKSKYFPTKSKYILVEYFLATQPEESSKELIALLPTNTLERGLPCGKRFPTKLKEERDAFLAKMKVALETPLNAFPESGPTIVHFIRLCPPDPGWEFSIDNILGLKLLCQGGEKSSAYWWTWYVQDNFKFSVRVTLHLRDREETDNEWDPVFTTKEIRLTDNLPQNMLTIYDKCDQGACIGVAIQGVVVVEVLPDEPWHEKDWESVPLYIKQAYSWPGRPPKKPKTQ